MKTNGFKTILNKIKSKSNLKVNERKPFLNYFKNCYLQNMLAVPLNTYHKMHLIDHNLKKIQVSLKNLVLRKIDLASILILIRLAGKASMPNCLHLFYLYFIMKLSHSHIQF